MSRHHWLMGKLLDRVAKKHGHNSKQAQARPRMRMNVETLEDRVTPATFVVNSAADNTTDDGDLTLREAILAANGTPANDDHLTNGGAPAANGDVIIFNLPDNTTIILTDELPTITDDVVIDGSAVAGLTITGDVGDDNNAANNVRIFEIDTANNEAVTIANLILTEGNTANSPGDNGGAILIADGENVTLNNVQIAASIAAERGGAIFNGNGTLTITNSNILTNSATGADADDGGGGLYSLGGTVTITNTTFNTNTATTGSGSGGGILINGGSLTMTGGRVLNNSAVRAGGGIEFRSTVSVVTSTITGVFFQNNTTGGNPGNGGAIHITAPSGTNATNVTVNSSLFFNNTASEEGGGLWNDVAGTLTINTSTISGNTASGAAADQGGGGVFNNGGVTIINNSTISGNIANGAAGSGGGVLNDGGTLTITGGTISGNTAIRAGGGIEATAQNRNSSVTLTNVNITGNSTGNSPGNGGGIHVTDLAGGTSSTFTINGGTIAGNIANQEGGGVWNDDAGTMTITGTLIVGNTANAANASGDQQGGGGIFNRGTLNISGATITANTVNGTTDANDGGGGLMNVNGTVTITNTIITNNTATATNGNGGGILNVGVLGGTATVTVTGGTISGNAAARAGGGIENNAQSPDATTATVTLNNVLVNGNSAGVNGGAVHITTTGNSTGQVTATNSTFSNNQAGNEGGGLWNANGINATITLTSSTVSNNRAVFGGGLFNDGTAGTITLVNTTISGNTATEGGGIDTEGGTLDIDHSTIVNNSASLGGGLNIDAGSTVTVDNTIIANNTASTGADLNGTITANFSLIESTTGGTINGANNITGVDPKLGPLQNNGGPTLTHQPLAGSPVVNAGDPNFTPPPNTDQRGFPRVLGGRLDIGSVEGPAPLPPGSSLVVGSDAGPPGQVNVFNPLTGQLTSAFIPFAGFTGGVRVATGDVNGDGVADIIVGAGPGAPGGHVKVFDGSTGAEIRSFFSFPGFTGGVFVGSGDVNADGFADIIVGADAGGPPHVMVFSGQNNSVLASFFAFVPTFNGGVRVAAGDVNGDSLADIIVGAGAGAPNGHVVVVDAAQRTNVLPTGQIAPSALLASFFAFPGFRLGVNVGAGDVNGDGRADILVGAGAAVPHVRVFSGADNSSLASFIVSTGTGAGVRVSATDRNGDDRADIVAATGSTSSPATLSFFDGLSGVQLDSFLAFNPPFFGGIFVDGI